MKSILRFIAAAAAASALAVAPAVLADDATASHPHRGDRASCTCTHAQGPTGSAQQARSSAPAAQQQAPATSDAAFLRQVWSAP